MPDSKLPVSLADTASEPLDGTSDDSGNTATTMRLRVLDLEGELWPENQGCTDGEEGAGTAPQEDRNGEGG